MPTPPRCNCLSQSHGQSSSRGVDGGGGMAACPDQGVHTGIRHEIPAWPTSHAKKDGEARDSPKRWISFRSNLLHKCDGIVSFPKRSENSNTEERNRLFRQANAHVIKNVFSSSAEQRCSRAGSADDISSLSRTSGCSCDSLNHGCRDNTLMWAKPS